MVCTNCGKKNKHVLMLFLNMLRYFFLLEKRTKIRNVIPKGEKNIPVSADAMPPLQQPEFTFLVLFH